MHHLAQIFRHDVDSVYFPYGGKEWMLEWKDAQTVLIKLFDEKGFGYRYLSIPPFTVEDEFERIILKAIKDTFNVGDDDIGTPCTGIEEFLASGGL